MKDFPKISHFFEMDIQCGIDKMKTTHRKSLLMIIYCNKIIKAQEMIIECYKIRT